MATGTPPAGEPYGISTATTDALNTKNTAYENVIGAPASARSTRKAKTAALRTVQSNGRFLARTCIRSLMPVLGEDWNSAWQDAGFTGGSLAVPANPLPNLQQLRAYYAANPTKETANVNGIAYTAAGCETAVQAISTAQSNSNQSNTDAGTAHANYLAGFRAARTRLSNLRDELSQLMGDDDERWYAFGFDKPSDGTGPEVPENLVVTVGAPGSRTLLPDWDDARRATNYRLRAVVKATGQQVFSELVADSHGIITLPNLAEKALENAAHPLARALRLLLLAQNNPADAEQWDMSLTNWRQIQETVLLNRARALHTALLPHTTGTDPAELPVAQGRGEHPWSHGGGLHHQLHYRRR